MEERLTAGARGCDGRLYLPDRRLGGDRLDKRAKLRSVASFKRLRSRDEQSV